MSPTKATKKPTTAGPSPFGADRSTGRPEPKPREAKLRADAEPRTSTTSASNDGPGARVANSSSQNSSSPNSSLQGSTAKAVPKLPAAESRAESRAVPVPVDPKLDPKPEAKAEPKPDPSKLDPKLNKAPSAVQTLAAELIAANDLSAVQRHAAGLEDERDTTANQAARLMQELAELKPELLVPLIERFARLVASKNKRVVATTAAALAPLSRIAPAKVAKQLPLLTQNWEHTTEEGKDGLVRTFAGLCTASVAYQKRLEPALARALGEAEPKLLIRWTEIVLPALKGEPHARARAVVEERLPQIPRPQAQKIADFLGIKLRPLPR